jgi:TatD DNase family protein
MTEEKKRAIPSMDKPSLDPSEEGTADSFFFIDTHCHLEMSAYDSDREEVIMRAESAGVKRIVTVGSDVGSSDAAVRMAREYENVYATVGIHPHDAKDYNRDVESALTEWAKDEKTIAIGETGLDYHYEHSPRGIQQEIFEKQLNLAENLDLPVVVHSRSAREDTLRILRKSGVNRGVMHCFSGDQDMAEQAMSMGFYISFAGPVTFKNSRSLSEIVLSVPDEYILLETDSPYLTPSPYRGKRNEPAYLVHTAQKIAELRGVSRDDIARITTLNADRLFQLEMLSEEGAMAYKIRNSLYLNITNRCTNACSFCVKFHSDYVKGHNLRLEHEPSLEELKEAINNPQTYGEVVFCGYGEPFMRLDMVKTLARWIKERGGRVRINTNGHGNMIHGRNILPELKGLVDSVSVSLDAHDAKTYERICRPLLQHAFDGVIEFIREAQRLIPEVTVTVVDLPDVDIKKCKTIAEDLGVQFRLREYNIVG